MGGCQRTLLFWVPERGEYAFAGLDLVAKCIRWLSIRYEIRDRWLSELMPGQVSATASHQKGINQCQVLLGEHSAEVALHEPNLIVNSRDTPNVNRSM